MNTNENEKYEAMLRDLHALWNTYLQAGVEFFLRLKQVEIEGTWKLRHETFQDFLKREFPNALGLERYEKTIQKIEEYGPDFMRKLGADVPDKVLTPKLVENPAHKAEFIDAVNYHIETEKCAPGKQKIRDIIHSIVPETRRPCREVQAVRAEAREESEVERLRIEVASLKRENKKLKAENRQLKRELRQHEKVAA